MTKRFLAVVSLLIMMSLLIGACTAKDEEKDPTTDPNRVSAAQTALAQTSPTPRPDATSTPLPNIESELAQTVARMARAVREGDVAAYFGQIAQDDPVFLADQQAWTQMWLDEPLADYTARLSLIEVKSETEAIARMTVAWTRTATGDGQSGGSTITVRFVKESPDSSTWLFAGEAWETVRLFWDGTTWTQVWNDDEPPTNSTERLRVYYLIDHGPIEGTRLPVETLLEDLPGIYNVVLDELEHDPTAVLHIKFYDKPDNLQLMTRIGLSPIVQEWNLPNESLKITIRPNTNLPPNVDVLAALLTQNVLYQIADNRADVYPFWVMNGAQNLVQGKHYETFTWVNNNVEATIARLPNAEEIAPTDSPLLGAEPNGIDGHVFLLYIDEIYGAELRNTWLKAIAGGASVEEASETVFAKTFEELNGEWLIWLSEQI